MAYLKAIIALFVIIDPIGNIPVFLAVTKPLEDSSRKRAFNIAIVVAFLILLVFSLSGQFILDEVFQIKIADLRIAGGILLFLIAMHGILNHGHSPAKSGDKNLSPEEIGCVPLACPLIAGPGAMVTSLTIWNDPDAGALVAIVAIASVLIVFWVLMRFIGAISHPFGKLIITAVSKVTFILVAAIAVNMVVQGIMYYINVAK
ncbi:MAG: MarC family protein [Planctomycetes bacterium]|nr:MarC family protein [Planctomycetota bacterium]